MSDSVRTNNVRSARLDRRTAATSKTRVAEHRSVHRPKYEVVQTRRAVGGDTPHAPTEGERQQRPDGTIRAETLQQQDAARQRPRYDGGKDATELYEAMHGGMWGVGTDEDRIFRALDGKSPQQIDEIRKSYRDHYGRDLDADLRDELGGDDLKRAKALMSSSPAAADAAKLHDAMDGAGTDEQAIYDALQGKSQKEIDAIRSEYRSRYGRSLDGHIRREMSGDDLKRAEGLLRGDTAAADATRLHDAVDGVGTDEAAVFDTLEGKSRAEIREIEKAYRRQYGRSLRQDLDDDLGGAERDRARALLDGRSAEADAARIHEAVSGIGTDEEAIEDTLRGKSKTERDAIAAAYEKRYGETLDAALAGDMSGDDLERVRSLQENGQLCHAERLRSAMDGLGTDEREIRSVLDGRTKAEIASIRDDYRERYGRDLDADLASELSGRDWFEVSQALKGKPESEAEALQRMNERHEYERGNGLSNFIMDSLSSKGALLDRNHRRANAAYDRAMTDGTIDAAEQERLRELTGYVVADVTTYQGAKDSAGETVGTVAAIGASVAVVVGTAGTATPLVATAFAAAGAGAAARTLTVGAIQGNAFGVEQAFEQAGYGAIDGVATAVGMRAGQAVAQGALRATAANSLRAAGQPVTNRAVAFASRNLLANSMRSRVAFGALEGAVDGAIGGGLGAGGITAARSETWDDGFGAGLGRVGQATALGTGLGAAGGALGGGIASRNSTRLADDLVARAPLATGGRAGVDDWGFDAMRRDLTEQLDEARRTGSDPQRVAALERDIARLSDPEALRQSLLRSNDVGRVHSELARLGVTADREMVETVKRYLFDSAGIGFHADNFQGWTRIAQGRGTLADAQFLVHEMAEVQALRRVQQQTGFDFLGRNVDNMSERQARQWQHRFHDEYVRAHRQALEAEYDFVARQVTDATNGQVRVGRNVAAAIDSTRREAVEWMLADGIPLGQHRQFAQWASRGDEVIRLSGSVARRYGYAPGTEVTLRELIRRIKHTRPQ